MQLTKQVSRLKAITSSRTNVSHINANLVHIVHDVIEEAQKHEQDLSAKVKDHTDFEQYAKTANLADLLHLTEID